MQLKIQKFTYFFKKACNVIKSTGQKGYAETLKLQQSRAKNYVKTIPEKAWYEMSNALFQTASDKTLPLIENLKKLKQSCLKNDTNMPKEVEQAFLELERKAIVFNERLGIAKSKGKTPQNVEDFGEKFKENNKKQIDIIEDYLDKLEVKMCGYDLPYKEFEANKESFKESRKTISKIRFFANEVFDILPKDIYNHKIIPLADGILEQGQTFYHGTGKASRIKKAGFSLLPSKYQAGVAPRELGEGVYMTPDKEVAAYYAGINGSIIQANVELKNVAVANNYQQSKIPEVIRKVLGVNLSSTFSIEAIVKELFKRNGYDAIYSREALGTGFSADTKLIDKLSGGKQSQLVVLDAENIKIIDKTFKQRVENQLLQTKRFAKNIVSTLKDIIFRDF